MIMNTKTKENILTVILALLGLVYVTAVVGWVFSLEPHVRGIPVYITNSTGK